MNRRQLAITAKRRLTRQKTPCLSTFNQIIVEDSSQTQINGPPYIDTLEIEMKGQAS
jgi:hypothetical protein